VVRYLFYTIGDLTYQSPLVLSSFKAGSTLVSTRTTKFNTTNTALSFRVCSYAFRVILRINSINYQLVWAVSRTQKKKVFYVWQEMNCEILLYELS